MTVIEKQARKLISGSGWTNPLTHNFELENETHLKVYADETLLTLGVDYHISGVLDEDGYSVTINNTALWSPTVWVLSVEPPINQQSDISLGGAFGARYEDAADAIVRRLQRLRDLADRSIKMPVTAALGTEYRFGTPVPGAVLGWNDDGTEIIPTSYSLTELQELVDDVEDLVDLAVNNGATTFDTYAQAAAYTFPVGTRTFSTRGYAARRDGGGAEYAYWDPAEHGGNAYPESLLIDNKVQNGNFLIDLFWTKPAGFTISGSKGTATGCTGDLTQSIMTMAGFYDEITFRLYGTSNADPDANYLQVLVGSTGPGTKYSADGLYTVRILRAGSGGAVANPNLVFRMVGFTGSIRAVRVRQVYKPLYGVINATFRDGSTGYFMQAGDINPKAMGAKGDGVTDDTLILRDAQLFNSGLGRKVILPDGDYVYTAWLTTFLGHAFDNIGFTGVNKGKARLVNKCATNFYNMLITRGTITPLANAEPITFAAPQSSNRLRVASPTANYYGETPGTWLSISDPSQVIYNQTSGLPVAVLGEMVQVDAAESTSQIRLRQCIQNSYTTSAVIRKLRRPSSVTLKDISVIQIADGDIAQNCQPLVTVYAEKIRVSGCHFEGLQCRVLDLNSYTHDYRVEDCTGKDIKDNTIVPAYFIAVGMGSTDGFVENCRIDRCRHFITSGAGTVTEIEADRCTLTNCWAFNTDASGFDSHAAGIRNLVYDNCHAHRRTTSGTLNFAFYAAVGFQIRSRFAKVNNCSATGYWFGANAVQGSDCHIRNFDAASCMVGVAITDSPRTTVKGLRVFGDHAQALTVTSSGIVTPMERIGFDDIEVYGTTNGDNASGYLILDTNPADGDTVVLNGFTYTFRTSPGAGSGTSTDIQIGSTREDTAYSLITAMRVNPFSNLVINLIGFSLSDVVSNIIYMRARQPGTSGNAITLAKTGSSVTLSGATFTGGGDNLAAVYYQYWEDNYSVGSIKLPVGATAPKFAGVIPTEYAYGYRSVTANATLKPVVQTVLADTTAGNITLTLPKAAYAKGVRLRGVKTAGANTLTWDGDGSETIDGSATKAITTNACIFSNGTAWFTESAA